MRLTTILAAALAGRAAAQNSTSNNTTTTAPAARSIFVAPDQSLAFALSIPDDGSGKLYFTLAVQTAYQWGAIGLGNDHMPGTLVLMAYANGAGTNVTFSPRLAGRNAEPAPYADLQVRLLNGTTLANGTMMVRGVCNNCLSWPGGSSVDVKSTTQKAIYALGPEGSFNSDDPAAALKFHSAYGSFTIDMAAATGPAAALVDAPVLDKTDTKQSSGAILAGSTDGKKDWYSVFHALIMIFCFIGLMPLGILIIRLGEWARWHAVNQGFAFVLVLVGAGLGFYVSGFYNRTKNYNTPHQVIGIIVLVGLLAQFCLGFFHHRTYKKTKQTTKLRPYHVWLGRVIIPLGVANGFLGFPLALAPGYNYILGGLVIAIFPVMVVLIVCKKFVMRLKRHLMSQPEPEERGEHDTDEYLPRYEEASGAPIGLSNLRPDGSERKETGPSARIRGLGSEAAPREYV